MGDITYRHVFLSNDTTSEVIGQGMSSALACNDATDDSLLNQLAGRGAEGSAESPEAHLDLLFRQAPHSSSVLKATLQDSRGTFAKECGCQPLPSMHRLMQSVASPAIAAMTHKFDTHARYVAGMAILEK